MNKQLQDAYIVAATRTAVGKAALGLLRIRQTLLVARPSAIAAAMPLCGSERCRPRGTGCDRRRICR